MVKEFLKPYRQPLRLWWLWFVSACALVIFVCAMSLINLSQTNIQLSDKTLHFVAYWSICIWWLQILRGRWVGLLIVIAAICMGVGLEIAQSFHPMRHMDYRDAIANSFGACLGYLCAVCGLRHALVWLEPKLLALLGR